MSDLTVLQQDLDAAKAEKAALMAVMQGKKECPSGIDNDLFTMYVNFPDARPSLKDVQATIAALEKQKAELVAPNPTAAVPARVAAEHAPPPAREGSDGAYDTHYFESGAVANEQCFATLRTILKNLIAHPTDPKFRRLRFDNPTVKRDVVDVPGAAEFIQSVGFSREADAWVLPMGGATDQHINGALLCLAALEQQTEAASHKTQELQFHLNDCMWEIRLEKWATAVRQEGDLKAFTKREIMSNSRDDATELVNLLCKILENIVDNPESDKFRTLQLTNATVRNRVWNVRGGPEVLVGICHFKRVKHTLELPRADATPLKDVVAWLRSEVLRDMEATFAAREREERELAIANFKREREDAKRELVKAQQPPPSQKVPPSSGSGKRIPIAEAMKHLLGRDKEE